MSSRVILVTGANGGLGLAIARSFIEESKENFVYLAVRASKERANQLSREFPAQAACIDLDVTQSTSWAACIRRILDQHSRIDVLVNNAGKHCDGLLANLSTEAWDGVLATNLDGVFHGCQSVMSSMISQRGGRIINISSLSALLAPAGQTNYAAAKAGVVALTQSLAKEVARIGITVNAICPGYIETDAIAQMNPDEKKAAVNKVPMRRFGKPEEVAAAVRFLASRDASYITGSVLKIDGGIL
jgi:3-oxoacyl-[acyl-carrier protein] reductase